MNIKIYSADEIDKIIAKQPAFTDNGLVSVKAKKSEMFCSNNYEYYCNVEIPLQIVTDSGVTIDYTTYFVQDNIIAIETLWGEQYFRINNPEKTNSSLKTKASHVVNDLKNYSYNVEYSNIGNLFNAMSGVFTNSGANSVFTYTISSVQAIFQNYHMLWSKDNATTTVYDCLIYFAKLWQLQIVFDKFNITLQDYPSALSSDIVIKDTNILISENWDNVCTKCIANGYRNLRTIYTSSTQYDRPYTKFIQFQPSNGVDTASDSEVIADLLSQATDYTNAHLYPEVNYQIDSNLSTTIKIGDPIAVKHNKLKVDLIVAIISVTWDCINQKYVKVEFGNFTPSIKSFANKVENEIKIIKMRLGQGGL